MTEEQIEKVGKVISLLEETQKEAVYRLFLSIASVKATKRELSNTLEALKLFEEQLGELQEECKKFER